jgi:MOSC domain-containing protein YiiM
LRVVEHLFMALVHRFPARELEEAMLVLDKGVEGCIHGRRGSKRQVLLMDATTLQRLRIPPGSVKENITTRGLELDALAVGVRLQVREAVLEVTGACHPCNRMDEIRFGLQEELRGQRGILCRVIQAGRIHRGDAIEIVAAARAASQGRGEA